MQEDQIIQPPQREDDYHREQRERIERLEARVDALENKPKLGRPPKDKEKENANTVI